MNGKVSSKKLPLSNCKRNMRLKEMLTNSKMIFTKFFFQIRNNKVKNFL